MKVLALHSSHAVRGGEDESFDIECRLLEDLGCVVTRLVTAPDWLLGLGHVARLEAVVRGAELAKHVSSLARIEKPDVAYINNLFPAVGPSVIDELGKLGIPVVVAVRNFRFECVAGTCFRDYAICRSCAIQGSRLPGIGHRCYRGSTTASIVATSALVRAQDAYDRHGSVHYACVSDFVANRLLESIHVSPRRVHRKPNTTLAEYRHSPERHRQVAVIGRLEREKGIEALLRTSAKYVGLPIVFAGEGSLRPEVELACQQTPGWSFVGRIDNKDAMSLLSESRAALVPSLWEEPFGRTAVEALAMGTPAVVTRRGGLPEVLGATNSGMIIEPHNPSAIVSALHRYLADDAEFTRASVAARARFKEFFAPESVGRALLEILEAAKCSD